MCCGLNGLPLTTFTHGYRAAWDKVEHQQDQGDLPNTRRCPVGPQRHFSILKVVHFCSLRVFLTIPAQHLSAASPSLGRCHFDAFPAANVLTITASGFCRRVWRWCMNQTQNTMSSLTTDLTNLIRYWPTYFQHLIQNCTANQGLPFLSFTTLGSQSPSNDSLKAIKSVFNMTLQIVSLSSAPIGSPHLLYL